MAKLMLLGDANAKGNEMGKTVRRWESGENRIPMSIQILVRLIERQESVRDYLGIEISKPK